MKPRARMAVPRELRGQDRLLVRCDGGETIAGRMTTGNSMKLLDPPMADRDPQIWWQSWPISVDIDHAYTEILRTYFFDKELTEDAWILLLPQCPWVLRKGLSPDFPNLHLGRAPGGRWALLDQREQLVLMSPEVWRDTDLARGVTAQFHLPDLQHPLWFEALLTAFSMRG
ncbi:MAG: hypothetical protein J0H02_03550 [Armatimonadetes bacterium]|nr:hypothetical protein [Armatimonadota bacterium]